MNWFYLYNSSIVRANMYPTIRKVFLYTLCMGQKSYITKKDSWWERSTTNAQAKQVFHFPNQDTLLAINAQVFPDSALDTTRPQKLFQLFQTFLYIGWIYYWGTKWSQSLDSKPSTKCLFQATLLFFSLLQYQPPIHKFVSHHFFWKMLSNILTR
jgi:hypothetical protein